MKQLNGQEFLEDLNLQTPSTKNELELVVFGRGYGESILFKYADSEYMVIDSFINPQTNNPIVIDYLNAIKIPSSDIHKVVITHWHQDHIAGISEIINNAFKDVKIILNPMVRDSEFLDFLSISKKQQQESTKEFVKVFDYIEKYGPTNLVLASNNKLLLDTNDVNVKALSPQDSEVWNYIRGLQEQLLEKGVGYDIPDNNELSVVLLLKYDNNGVLLGSDLEDKKEPNCAWNGIVQKYNDIKSRIFKVPHHGSENAHNPNVWQSMLEPYPVSILTTFNKSTKLPKDEDKNRILALSKELYILGSKLKRNKEVEYLAGKTIPNVSINSVPQQIGMLRYRYNMLTKQSRIETFGACQKLINNEAF